jgi:hypothetical protein
MKVRVYKPAKNAMQSGQAATKHWVMEFEPGAKKVADQLMGWIGSTDTRGQVRMYFETLEEAQAFAAKHKLIADIEHASCRSSPMLKTSPSSALSDCRLADTGF